MKKRRRLEYATEDSGGDERPDKGRKNKNKTECEDMSNAANEEESSSGDSKKKNTGKKKHKNSRHFKK